MSASWGELLLHVVGEAALRCVLWQYLQTWMVVA